MATTIISAALQRRFARAEKVLALTGAGVSAESGVPTFRGGGQTAVWKGMPFDQISSARMGRENLAEVWAWFNYRRRVIATCGPNPAHVALARWAAWFPDFKLVTQNIDGLHQAAGSREVIELHGNLNQSRCEVCGRVWEQAPAGSDNDGGAEVPRCRKRCGRLRPNVVLFGEYLSAEVLSKAEQAAQNCDMCFVVGASSLVYPAARLPEIALSVGAYVVEVNPEATPLSPFCHEVIRARAGEALPLLARQ